MALPAAPPNRVGHVYYLEHPAVRHDPGHYFLCLQDDPADSQVLLAYGTSQTTEARKGAPFVAVAGDPGTNGLRRGVITHFHPTIVYSVPRAQLPRSIGSITQPLKDVGDAFRAALGVIPAGGPILAGTLRGRIVGVNGLATANLAVVLTSHEYSAANSHQIVVPVVFRLTRTDMPNVFTPLGRMDQLAAAAGFAGQYPHALPSGVFSLSHHNREVGEVLPNVIDPSVIDRLAREVDHCVGLP